MAAIRNTGFELPGIVPGDALGWRLETMSSAIAYAEFGPSTIGCTFENMETGWMGNEFPATLDDIEFAVFDQGGVPSLVDDFERGWMSNENAIPDIGAMPVQLAAFGGAGGAEDFEQQWMNNENAIQDLGDMPVLDAAYGTSPAPQTRERFDQQWAGVPGEMQPLRLFLFTQLVNFVKATPDRITIILPGDFIASGVRPGATLNITGASPTNNGLHVVAAVTSTVITLTSSNALQSQNNVLAGISNCIDAIFDAQDRETMEFAWATMTEDF